MKSMYFSDLFNNVSASKMLAFNWIQTTSIMYHIYIMSVILQNMIIEFYNHINIFMEGIRFESFTLAEI